MTFDVGPRFAGPARDGCCTAERLPNPRSIGAHRMKPVDPKDLPSVPGGTSVPTQPVPVGTCFPPFPIPDPVLPVPVSETFNTKL